MKTNTYTIDASGITLGRVASKAAKVLIGKESTDYARNEVADVKVEIINASKVKYSLKKLTETNHERYSGYPGGLKFLTAEQIKNKKGFGELLKLAVHGMIPRNKLRERRMKNLKVTE